MFRVTDGIILVEAFPLDKYTTSHPAPASRLYACGPKRASWGNADPRPTILPTQRQWKILNSQKISCGHTHLRR